MFPSRGLAPSPAANKFVSVPAPVGGLNTRDSLAAMPLTDAPVLINWVPDIGGLRVRKGTLQWASGLAAVRSVFGYFGTTSAFVAASDVVPPSTASGTLFAATDAAIYNVSTRGAAPSSVQALSGTANAGHVHTTMFTNSVGAWLIVCSEVDGYYYFNGTTWTKITLGGGANQITGVTPGNLVYPCVFKKRLWFVEKNTTKAWYLAADAVTGAATLFDFGSQFRRGGNLAFLATWTIDAGQGIDDMLVAVSTMGDVVVYRGTDPASAATFALVGTWSVGPIPTGRRGHCQLGGDLLLLSVEGLYPVSYVTRGGADLLLASGKEYSSKITPSLSTDLRKSFTSNGWQLVIHSSERLLLVNVPDHTGVTERQYAMSTSLNAWCQFADIPVLCYGLAGQYLFAGTTDGRIILLNFGSQDEVPTSSSSGGNSISGVVQTAFSYLDTPARDKQFLMARPSFISSLEPSVEFDVFTNFTYETTIPAVDVAPSEISSLWDFGAWDVASWDGVGSTALGWADWKTVNGIGFSGSFYMNTVTYAATTFAAVDIMFQVGVGL